MEIVCDGGETLGRIDTSYTGGCMGSWKKKGAVAEESEGNVSVGEKLHERRQGESPQVEKVPPQCAQKCGRARSWYVRHPRCGHRWQESLLPRGTLTPRQVPHNSHILSIT